MFPVCAFVMHNDFVFFNVNLNTLECFYYLNSNLAPFLQVFEMSLVVAYQLRLISLRF